MKIAIIVIGFLLGEAAMSQTAHAGFPADGNFKMQPISTDHWYFYDEIHWYIKAPDKWQHLMGSYASTKIFIRVLDDKLSSATAVFLGGILKGTRRWLKRRLEQSRPAHGCSGCDCGGVRRTPVFAWLARTTVNGF